VLPVVRNGGRVQHEIHALALNAIAHELLGERALALESLGRATQLGEPGRFCRTFTAEGPVMAALLNALTDAVRRGRGPEEVGSTPYLVFLLSEMGSMPDAATASTPAAIASSRSQPQTLGDSVNASLPEPLSDREIEVIGLIASGASNQQIAEQLVVSLSTVKTHINRTYRKLDARSRTQAVAVARQLGLV
jgi:LuxR family maltose regulon positive regulatory protein